MSDGTLSVRRRQPKAGEGSTADVLRSGVFESFLGATVPGIGQGTVRGKVQPKPTGGMDELRVESKRRKRLKDYDKLLKSFKYSAALDSVLRKVGIISSPHTKC
jgi:U3 small nucleolar RNA-associated protein 15